MASEVSYAGEGLGPLRPAPGLGRIERPLADARGEAAPPLSPDLIRRAEALEKWRRRSAQIHWYRRALPTAMAAIVVFGIGWIGIRALISALTSNSSELGTIHLINPTFYGRNEKGELYILSAKEAVRAGDDPDRIALTDPDLKQYPVGAPEPMTARAHSGVYHEAKKQLDLTGNVVATDGRGYTFTSGFAHVDMPKNSVVGNSHVYAWGPQGSISADAYQVYDKGQHAIFTGDTHTHLTNQPPPKLAPRPPAKPELPAGAIPVPYRLFGGSSLRPPL